MAILQKSWFVYRTTNKINGHFYIGVHKGFVLDNYLGSGTALKSAIKKYGKLNFNRDVVAVLASREDAYELEALIVDAEFILRKDTYNLALGGRGHNGQPTKQESKLKMCKPKSKEHCEAISKGKLGVALSPEHILACANGRKGFKHSTATKRKMSAARSDKIHKIIECPHCGKTGGAPAMRQWHFNNCKKLGDVK